MTAAQTGTYSVVVDNAYGPPATSADATLTIFDSVNGLFDSGVSQNCIMAADGGNDPHYQLLFNADGANGIQAIVQDSTVFPVVGAWAPNTSTSKWIGPRFNTGLAAGLAGDGGVGPRVSVDTHFPIAVKVVEQHPLIGDGVMIRRDVLSEDRKPRIAVALLHIAEHLIVGAILLDDVDHVLDGRASADLARHDARLFRRTGHRQVLILVRDIVVDLLGPGLDLALQGADGDDIYRSPLDVAHRVLRSAAVSR